MWIITNIKIGGNKDVEKQDTLVVCLVGLSKNTKDVFLIGSSVCRTVYEQFGKNMRPRLNEI